MLRAKGNAHVMDKRQGAMGDRWEVHYDWHGRGWREVVCPLKSPYKWTLEKQCVLTVDKALPLDSGDLCSRASPTANPLCYVEQVT